MNWVVLMHMLCLVGIPIALVVIVRSFTDDGSWDGYAHGADNTPRGLSESEGPSHD